MAATGGQETSRRLTAKSGGSDALEIHDPKGMCRPKAGSNSTGTIGASVVPDFNQPIAPVPFCSAADIPLSPGLKERVLEAVRHVRPEARGSRVWFPWVCAAAAGLALVFSMGNLDRLDQEVFVYQAGLDELTGQVRALQARLDLKDRARFFPNDPGGQALLLLGTPKSPEARGAVFWSGQERKVRLYTSRLPQLSQEKTYQLWLIADKPVGAGTFRVNPTGQGYLEVVDLDETVPPVEIVVSMEPSGGASQLTGDVYLTGAY